MKKLVLICFILLCVFVFFQPYFKSFNDLSSPKKEWVISHLFKAKRALEISKETNQITDSINKTNLLDRDRNGGQVDAFRHAYWMARLTQDIGKDAAKSLGLVHEKENYLLFKELKLEDGVVPDKISSEMDIFNNNVGLTLTNKGDTISKNVLVLKIVTAIKSGRMRLIKKDEKNRYLTCNNKVITKKELKGEWINNKCLVKSNYKDY